MKKRHVVGRFHATLIILGVLGVSSCQKNELYVGNAKAGLNGSFEVVESGYPVNWAIFPSPENSKSTSVSLNSVTVRDGKYSIELVTQEIKGTTGIRTRRLSVNSRKRYRISFWAMNKAGAFQVNRVIRDHSGKKNIRAKIIARSSQPTDEWQRFDDDILIAENEKYLHLIFRVTEPGTLLIDDVVIEEVSGD